MHVWKSSILVFLGVLLVACGSAPKVGKSNKSTAALSKKYTLPKANSGRGAYYMDDGPGEDIPPNLELVLDAEPKVEPYSKSGNKPYVVFGKTYTPLTDDRPFSQRGIGSWYGKKFHGLRTSSGEPYDMYKMTAAHPTLPIPSYARITNLSNGKQVIVRVNDRGPFHSNRIVDLSYTAALKLDYLHKGSSELLLERLLPADIEKMAENKKHRVTETVANTASIISTSIAEVTTTPSSESIDTAKFEALLAESMMSESNQISTAAPPEKSNNVGGFYLQFGAFGLRENAEATFNRLQKQLSDLPTFEIVQQGTLYRLFSGPFANHDEAKHAVQLALNAGVVTKPVIVQR